MKEVIVYQMGKVASTAIVKSLERSGVKAVQSHFLDLATFHQMVDRFRNPNLLDEEMSHMVGQLSENLRLYNRVCKFVSAEAEKHVHDNKLGVITLTRNPLDWFYSNLSQNFFTTESRVFQWLGKSKDEYLSEEDEVSIIVDYLNEIFYRFCALIPNMQEDNIQLIRAAFRNTKGTAQSAIYSEMTGLLRPHFWFDQLFEPVFGIDPYQLAFDPQKGSAQYAGVAIDVLLVRYEDIEKNLDCFAELAGLPKFSLNKSNISSEKRAGRIIGKARERVTYPENFQALIGSSKYFQHFYS